MQVSALPPVWIAMIISCWSVKLPKLPSVTLTHVCGTNSHNWWAKGLPGVGVAKIFYDSDSSGWKSFRLRLLDSDFTALVAATEVTALCKKQTTLEGSIASDANYFQRIPTARKFDCAGCEPHYAVAERHLIFLHILRWLCRTNVILCCCMSNKCVRY